MLEIQEKEKPDSMDDRKKKLQEDDRKKKLQEIVVEIRNSILTAYFLVMMLLYPLYMKDGYQNIGDIKYFFFQKISLLTILLIACVAVVLFPLQGKRPSVTAFYKNLSGTDWFVYAAFFLCMYALPGRSFSGSRRLVSGVGKPTAVYQYLFSFFQIF